MSLFHTSFIPPREGFHKWESGIVIRLAQHVLVLYLGGHISTTQVSHHPFLSRQTNVFVNLSIKGTLTFLWRPIHSPYPESCFYLVTSLEQHSRQETCSGSFSVKTYKHMLTGGKAKKKYTRWLRIASRPLVHTLLSDPTHASTIPLRCVHYK